MAGVRRFEELEVWQKARRLTGEVYAVIRRTALAEDHGLAGQLRRSAVSIMANIAEGFERTGPAEFNRFLSMARASCAELRSHLYVALDTGQLQAEDFRDLLSLAEETGRMVSGLKIAVERRLRRSRSSSG